MTKIRAAASVFPLAAGPLRLLWAQRNDDAPALAGFHVGPGGLLEDGEGAPEAALRELFEEVGILHADGAEGIDEETRDDLRAAFLADAAEGAARLRELGLRFRTEDLEPVGRFVTPAHGGVARFDTHMYALLLADAPEPDPTALELSSAEWIAPADALARWGRGEVLIAPPMAHLLRSLERHGALRAEELSLAPGARGEESLRWEVVPSLQMFPFRTPTLPPATHTNAYLVGSGDAVLVEPATPYADEQDRFVAWVEESRRDGIRPRAIVATHHHVDHIGGASALAERLGLPLWAHAATAQRLAGRVRFDRHLVEGERIELPGPTPVSLRVLHTPGHAPGHVCLMDEASRAMIVGDMVASVGTILVEPEDGDMTLYLASLERMRAERPSLLLPAHGFPIRDADGLLRRYVEHRLAREAKVRSALERHLAERGAPASAAELVPLAYDDAPRAVWPLAAMSTEAHLIKLERDGVARRSGAGWSPAG